MRRVGVLGGTFDPPHVGHLRAAEVVREALALDVVLFVPSASPPHKTSPQVTDARHRLRMVELALETERFFGVSRIEVEREGPSYTIDTLAAMEAEDQSARLFFVAGTDAFLEIRTWRRWKELLGRYSFVVHERPGFSLEEAKAIVSSETGRPAIEEGSFDSELAGREARVFLLQRDMLDVSSTGIRSSVRQARSIRFLVPDSVEAYVREFRLYE